VDLEKDKKEQTEGGKTEKGEGDNTIPGLFVIHSERQSHKHGTPLVITVWHLSA
jgi:hypothetical protein